MPTNLGVKFRRKFFLGGGAEALEEQGRKIRGNNSLENIAENFTRNSPKIRQTKIKHSPQIRSAESRA